LTIKTKYNIVARRTTMAKKGFDSTPNRKGVDTIGPGPRAGAAGQQPPRAQGVPGVPGSHLSGFGNVQKQEKMHQKAVQNSGPDWGGQRRQARRNRTLELICTGILLLSAIVLFIAYVMPFFTTHEVPNPNYVYGNNTGDPYYDDPNLPGGTFSGMASFSAGAGLGLFVVLAFIFTIILIAITVLRLVVVAGKLQQLKFLDSQFGNLLIAISGVAVAVFAFLIYSSANALVAKGSTGEPVFTVNGVGHPIKASGIGVSILMPFGFIAAAVGLGVAVINILTTNTYKKAVKPTADSVKELKAQGSNFGFDRKANTFNRQAEVYQPAPIRTLADTAGPAPVFGQQPMDQSFEVDEFGNPIMPTEQDLQQGMADGMMQQDMYAAQAPQYQPAPPQHQAPVAPTPAPRPAPQASNYAAHQAPAAPSAANNSGLSASEQARQRLAEAKAKLEAAKNNK